MPETTYRLSDLDVVEVSLVDRPAIQRKFLVLKSENGPDVHAQAMQDVMQEFGVAEGSQEAGLFKRLWRRIVRKLMSDEQRRQMLQSALSEHVPPGPSGSGAWIEEVWPNECVYRMGDKQYKVAYTLGEDNKVTFGTAQEVRVEREYKPVRHPEADDHPPETPGPQMDTAMTKSTEGRHMADKPNEEMVSKADLEAAVTKAREEGKAEAAKLLTAELEKRDTQIADLQKAARRADFREHIRKHEWPGAEEDNVALMEQMASHLPAEAFKAWRDREDTRAAEIAKSELFRELGSATPTNGSVTEKVLADVGKGQSYDDKVKAVNPAEYAAAQAEASRKAQGIAR